MGWSYRTRSRTLLRGWLSDLYGRGRVTATGKDPQQPQERLRRVRAAARMIGAAGAAKGVQAAAESGGRVEDVMATAAVMQV